MPADNATLPAALEAAVLPSVLAADCVTVPQLQRRVRRAVLALDPVTAERCHQHGWPTGGWNITPMRTAWLA
ncbi:MAG TPA: hypothetical protein VH298_17400 [Jatrophihabitans sp.]|jgi:hypothetical protein|nr:hypothetical protein [Jatrophihabitans sp.]